MAIATAEKYGGLGNQQASRCNMRKLQRLAERRRAKRPEMRGLHMPAARPIGERFIEKVAARPTRKGCLNWTGTLMPNGYGQIHYQGKTAYAHRIAWELTNGPVPDGMDICHTCDNRRCVNLQHLFLGTRFDNVHDSMAKLRHAHGPRNGHAKLTVEQVREIRAAPYYRGLQSALAKKYDIAQAMISMIRARKTWKHV